MNILAVDCTASAASVALMQEDKVLAEFYTNVRLTHSQTLMPMVESLLRCAGADMGDVDLFAVSVGPGSFTGVRIGVSAVKGMAMAQNKPCVGVSVLEALAENTRLAQQGTVCAVMDARCAQVYNALFALNDGQAARLCDDRVLTIAELELEIKNWNLPVFLVGDGAELCYNTMSKTLSGLVLVPEPVRFQRAGGVAAVALRAYRAGRVTNADGLMPLYLRLPQAERQLKKRAEDGAGKAGRI